MKGKEKNKRLYILQKQGIANFVIFPKTPEVNKNSDGKPTAKNPKRNARSNNFICDTCPVFQVSTP